MLPLLLLAFRSLAYSPLRTGIVVAAVALGVAGFTGVQLTNDAMSRGVEEAWRAAVGTSHLQLRAFGVVGFSQETITRIRQLPEVAAVAPVAKKRVFFRAVDTRDLVPLVGVGPLYLARHVATPEYHRGFIELTGVDSAVEPTVRTYRLAAGRFLGPEEPDGVVVREGWAQNYGLRVGDSIELMTADGLRTFRLVGLLANGEAGIADVGAVVLTDLETFRQRFGGRPREGGEPAEEEAPGGITSTEREIARGRVQEHVGSLSLVLRSEQVVPALRQRLPEIIPHSYVVRLAGQLREEFRRSAEELQSTLMLFGATALFVSIFLILNTMEMTVVDQTRQIGQLRAAGATRRQIFLYLMFQSLTPGLVGIAAGLFAGLLIAYGLGVLIARTQDVALAAVGYSRPAALLSAGAGLAALLLSSLPSAIRAGRLDPLEMMQRSEALAEQRPGRRAALLGLVITVYAGLFFLNLPLEAARVPQAGLLFLSLTGLIFAAQFTVIAFSRFFAWLASLWGGLALQLAARNLSREVGRTALTVGGFMASISLLVGLTVVAVSSVRGGERWALSLVPSQYVVVSPVDQPAALARAFSGDEFLYASPIGFFSAQSGRSLLPVAAIEPGVVGAKLDFVEGTRQEALAALNQGGALVVPRRLAEARELRLGDAVELQTLAGASPFRVAGVVAQSFPSASGVQTLLMSRDDAAQLFGQQGFRLLFVEPRPAADPRAMAERVAELAERYGMSATTPEAIAADVGAAIWRLIALVGALVGIGLLVATFGTANTMMMNVAQRTRELSTLWAAGMSRAQMRAMIVTEGALMGVMGGILGVGGGALAALLLVSSSRAPGFEPLFVFPWVVAVAGPALGGLAAGLAALVPARIAAGRL